MSSQHNAECNTKQFCLSYMENQHFHHEYKYKYAELAKHWVFALFQSSINKLEHKKV